MTWTHGPKPAMNTHFFTSNSRIGRAICLLPALLGVHSAAIANTQYTFETTSGAPANGTLILGQPVDQNQGPLPGSTFSVGGFTFDLSVPHSFFWTGSSGTTLSGYDFASSGEALIMTQLPFPAQQYSLQPPYLGDSSVHALSFPTIITGTGNWVASAPPAGVPETGSTLAMLSLGLAGCAGLRNRLERLAAGVRRRTL